MTMTCTYPHCEPGQAGTHCRAECRTCCDGRCNQGRDCPLLREEVDQASDDMLESVAKVLLLAIGTVAGGVIIISLLAHLL